MLKFPIQSYCEVLSGSLLYSRHFKKDRYLNCQPNNITLSLFAGHVWMDQFEWQLPWTFTWMDQIIWFIWTWISQVAPCSCHKQYKWEVDTDWSDWSNLWSQMISHKVQTFNIQLVCTVRLGFCTILMELLFYSLLILFWICPPSFLLSVKRVKVRWWPSGE